MLFVDASNVKIRDGSVANRPIYVAYTAPSEQAALERFVEFGEAWGAKHPALVKLWVSAWAEMVPFLAFDVEIRKVV